MNLINGREVLISGGTGSLGKTLLKLLVTEHKPKGIRIFSRDELKQWELQQEVSKWETKVPIAFLIGDIRNKERIARACEGVHIVINCAAMKQVPACEYNPFEAIDTNINGVKNIIDACINNKVDKCFHISTDKAVYPVNLYGKTKAVAESLMIQGSVYGGAHGTSFNVCRYGNVLGSRGSIIPLFKEQAKTGQITITDSRMTRFWITLDKVAKFIINRINDGKSNKIYIPKIPSAPVLSVALAVAPGCSFDDIGIRKGEKLDECLICKEENVFLRDKEDHYEISPTDDPIISDSDWTYNSADNTWQLSIEEIKEMINESNL
jgi:UDP-N-acetylglucosamine 4,6-dehydratase